MVENPQFKHTSTQKTGGDPVEGADPGGTHPTRPGKPSADGTAETEQTTTSGDRNPHRESRTDIPSKQ